MIQRWAKAEQDRDQLVLFAERLDEAIGPEHPVRLFDEILQRLDFSDFEAEYCHRGPGRPPIHPRVLSGVLLYGVLTRIRTSRGLEEALAMRIDFRWLAEGRSIDHTTLSEFRRRHEEQLKSLFVQTTLVAREMGLTALETMAFDGTRVKANNARSANRTPERLKELRAVLQQKFEEFTAEAEAAETRAQEQFGAATSEALPQELADAKRRLGKINKALAEIDRLEAAGEQSPKRLPLTDPEARISPNKEGGFAANYTPVVGVDVESGLIITADVISGTAEEQHLLDAVDTVEQDFGTKPKAVLGDGTFGTGANLAGLEERGVVLYSPENSLVDNPAVRDDPTQPVPQSQWDRLPTVTVKNKDGQKQPQLTKAAFVYDEEQDCYYCPQGEPLTPRNTTTDQRKDGTQIKRRRYRAEPSVCAECPLKHLCLQKGAESRQVSRDQFDPQRERHARRMAQPESQKIYRQRAPVCERPFAVIKQHFGARQFLLRGLKRVRVEWRWLATAFNVKKLMAHLQANAARAGPQSG